MTYLASASRYEAMQYRSCGHSGLKLPLLSLGFWQNFGYDQPFSNTRAVMRRAFDLGVTHFDFANNYGEPYGSAESTAGLVLGADFARHRDELVISTKAGYDMWPGPYGIGGSRKYLTASLDQSLKRLGLDYVDIFYSHRADPETPLEETVGALDAAVRQGKALYVGISSYSPERTAQAHQMLRALGTPLLIHQASYSMFDRWVEEGLLDILGRQGVGMIAFSPLAQGLLTSRYLSGIPDGVRGSKDGSLTRAMLSEENIRRARALNEVAEGRGQTLAQMALAWVLRDERVSSALIGCRNTRQLEENLGALHRLSFEAQEVATINSIVNGSNVNFSLQSIAVGPDPVTGL